MLEERFPNSYVFPIQCEFVFVSDGPTYRPALDATVNAANSIPVRTAIFATDKPPQLSLLFRTVSQRNQ